METCMFATGTDIGNSRDSDHAQLMIHQLPPNIYSSSTQLHQVYERLRWGEASGADFLKMGIPEYRSRMNTLEKDLLLPSVRDPICVFLDYPRNYILMLRYWAATLFGRPYAPEILTGMKAYEGAIDSEGEEILSERFYDYYPSKRNFKAVE